MKVLKRLRVTVNCCHVFITDFSQDMVVSFIDRYLLFFYINPFIAYMAIKNNSFLMTKPEKHVNTGKLHCFRSSGRKRVTDFHKKAVPVMKLP